MRKGKRAKRFFKIAAIVATTPIILLWVLIVLLYMPPVQRYAVSKIESAVAEGGEYSLTIGSLCLGFPLKLNINDFSFSKDSLTIASGGKIAVNARLLPLLKGEVEVNYLSIEQTELDTRDLIENTRIKGNIGYFRTTARNIDLSNEQANIRLLHIYDTDIDVFLYGDSESEKDTTKSATNWKIVLHKGNIEKTKIAINMPDDTTTIAAEIGKLTVKEVVADIAGAEYSVEEIALQNGTAHYEQGTLTRDEAPLEHIDIENITLIASNLRYSPETIQADISTLTLNQPDGILITEGFCHITTYDDKIKISNTGIKSANGSFVTADATLPWGETNNSKQIENAIGEITVHIDKRDLNWLLTTEQKASLSTLPDSLLTADVNLYGTSSNIVIENAGTTIPGMASISMSGKLKEIENPQKREAEITFEGRITDITPFTGGGDTNTAPVPIDIKGTAELRGSICLGNITLAGDGTSETTLLYDLEKEFYEVKTGIDNLNISASLPIVPVKKLTMSASLSGAGTDVFSPDTYYQLIADIDALHIDSCVINDITLKAYQADTRSFIALTSASPAAGLTLTADSRITDEEITNHTTLKIDNLSLHETGLTKNEVSGTIHLDIEAATDMNETHSLKLTGDNITINSKERKFTPSPIFLDISTAPDGSRIEATNGDLKIDGKLASGYMHLLAQTAKIEKMFEQARTSERTMYYATDFEKELPPATLKFECGNSNMLANFLAINGITIKSAELQCATDTTTGITMKGAIYNFKTTDLKLDTIRVSAIQTGEKIKYFAGVRSSAVTPENKKQSFSAALFGNLERDTLNTNFTLFGNERENVTRVGINTILRPEGLDIQFNPQAHLLGTEVEINKDNLITIGKDNAISANIRATDKEGAGVYLYTIADSSALHDISIEIFNINLGGVCAMLPFAPDISGMFNSDIHYRSDKEGTMFSGDIRCDSIAYQGTVIGNENTEIVYLPKQGNTHFVSMLVKHNEQEVIEISGDYTDGNITGEATITHLPLRMTNAFLQGNGFGLDGYIGGNITLEGDISTPRLDGYIKFDSVYADAPMLGSRLRLIDDKVNIEESKIIFDNFNIYANGDTPFKINGKIDIGNIGNPAFDLKMQARNYELVSAPRQKNSIVYGNLYIDINSFITGRIQSLKIFGNATVLGNTNITYVMNDAGIATNNELDGLVEFVNFADSTKTARADEATDWGNITMSMSLNIEEGAWINADFDSNRSSYITLQGGGQLNMSYTSEAGVNLTGRYTLNSGEMKYSLPIIPLKTFNISSGSYVNWTGDPANPTLSITALERVVAPVSVDGGNSQPVAFDVGLVLSNSLENIGLNFTMKAPENAAIQDELNALDAETLNKYAVTMLITGAYVGSNGGLTVSNALTSFLDAKINDIAGDAMKSVSINVGITDVENNDTGGSYTNYSFSFTKRFWNDRLTVVIGGEVNSGDTPDENQSFINNVSLEWRITADGNRYLRIFYDKNYESVLEGEITETGVGYVYKRKLNSLDELFIFGKHKEENVPPKEKEEKE